MNATEVLAIWQHGDIYPPKFLVLAPDLNPIDSKYHHAQDGDVFVVRPGEKLNFWVVVEDICPSETRHGNNTPWAYPHNADITAQGVPAGATLEGQGRAYQEVTWTPTLADIGTYDITFAATFPFPSYPNTCEQAKADLYSAVGSITVKVVVSETHPKANAGKDKGGLSPFASPQKIYEDDGGATFRVPAFTFSGAGYGNDVASGNGKEIIWDAGRVVETRRMTLMR